MPGPPTPPDQPSGPGRFPAAAALDLGPVDRVTALELAGGQLAAAGARIDASTAELAEERDAVKELGLI